MKRKLLSITGLLLLLVGVVISGRQIVHGSAPRDQINLTPEWTTGITSDGAGPQNIIVTDLTNDGIADTITCTSQGSAYVLNKVSGPAVYDTIFYSPLIGCSKIAVGDRDGNGTKEIYVGTVDGRVYIYLGDSFAQVGTFALPAGANNMVNDIAVADVDGDNQQEIVIATQDNTFVYDATTLALKWQATGKGGTSIGIGQIDTDPQVEIVVNGNPAHILDATHHIEKWAYSGGFGTNMAVFDLDGDGMAEISYVSYADLYVFDADTQTVHWHVHSDFSGWIAIGAGIINGIAQVVVGNDQWGNVTGFRGNDGTQLWSIPNPLHGVFGIGIGDTNNDGSTEVLWGAGISDSGADGLFIGDPVSQTTEWNTPDLDGPLHIAAGDLNNDGRKEIVMATTQTNSYYNAGEISGYDGTTHQLQWTITPTSTNYLDIYQLAIGQLDNDPNQEIAVAGNELYNSKLRVYDGVTHELQWETPYFGYGYYSPAPLIVKNIDNDPVDEIIFGVNMDGNYRVEIFNGASNVIQWDSGPLDAQIQDLAVGDLDGNGVLDLAIVTSQSIYVYEVGTWNQRTQTPVSQASHLAIIEGHSGSPGQLLIVQGTTLLSWSGDDFHLLWQSGLGNVYVNRIVTADYFSDGQQEFTLLGQNSDTSESVLSIGQPTNPPTWLYQNQGMWGSLDSMFFTDLNGDGYPELGFGAQSLIQVNRTDLPGIPTPTPTSTWTPVSTVVPTATATTVTTATATSTATTTVGTTATATSTATTTALAPSTTTTATAVSSPTAMATPTQCAITFTDVPSGSTFYPFIRCLACRGIINGYTNGTFKPNNNVTRGQLSKIVANAADFSEPSRAQQYQDIAPGSTFFDYVWRLSNRGIISGYPCGGAGEPCVQPNNLPYFRPNNNATRGQITKIVSNAAGFTDLPSGQQFEDVAVGSTYYTYTYRLVSRAIMSGYACGGANERCVPPDNRPYFRPNANATRGQTSKIVSNTFFPLCDTPGSPRH